MYENPFVRIVLVLVGLVSVLAVVVGIFLVLLSTVPFLLLASGLGGGRSICYILLRRG
jgi:hypothetical protein